MKKLLLLFCIAFAACSKPEDEILPEVFEYTYEFYAESGQFRIKYTTTEVDGNEQWHEETFNTQRATKVVRATYNHAQNFTQLNSIPQPIKDSLYMKCTQGGKKAERAYRGAVNANIQLTLNANDLK